MNEFIDWKFSSLLKADFACQPAISIAGSGS